jgi:hypothetical protein
MKKLALALVLSLASTGAFAQAMSAPTTCKASAKSADGKMLAGAAMKSHMKKCETDAKKACESKAAEQKLNGAAKNSFTKKCVTDAVGA